MIDTLHIALISVCAVIFTLLCLLTFKRCLCNNKTRKGFVVSDTEQPQTLQNGIARLHQVSPHHPLDKNNTNYQFYPSSKTKTPFFNWDDHPSLITEAVENGWPRFAFTTYTSSKSTRSTLLGVCATADNQNQTNIEIGWEVSEGSSDYLQKIRINPGLKKTIIPSLTRAVSLIRTGLPLPGPNSSFPQEAYFEITILPFEETEKKSKLEGERIKLIGEDFNASTDFNNVGNDHSQRRSNVLEELRIRRDIGGGGKNEVISLCVGLTGEGPLSVKLPGSYPGSIGFNSSGSVNLDGTKLVHDSENNDWGRADKIIGCGYNPSQKKVFFTVDSQLVHEIHCKTEEFSFPLYPTLAANADVMVLVNLGQSPFQYALANLRRTSNPCFIGSLGNSPAIGYEDSKELFSMGRIDSLWHQRSATRSNNNTVNSIKALDYDQESEGELFEIVLDNMGRSPYATPSQ